MLGYRNLVCGCAPHAWGAFAPAKGSLNNMKAIIPAAGLGTRFLPGTKCTPKEMLPVLDKPVIQYVVEEALDPEEVDDAIIVTSPGKPELLNYFQPDRSLENLLRERGKNAYADAVAHAGGMPVDFRYQYEPKGLGHAIRSAADAVAGENFLVLLGDYVVPNRDICDKMLAVSKEHGGASVIAVAACSPEEVSRYGVIAGERVGSLEGAEDVAFMDDGGDIDIDVAVVGLVHEQDGDGGVARERPLEIEAVPGVEGRAVRGVGYAVEGDEPHAFEAEGAGDARDQRDDRLRIALPQLPENMGKRLDGLDVAAHVRFDGVGVLARHFSELRFGLFLNVLLRPAEIEEEYHGEQGGRHDAVQSIGTQSPQFSLVHNVSSDEVCSPAMNNNAC
jgi:CTP:molybdopterin cytidylyltransferase MocA